MDVTLIQLSAVGLALVPIVIALTQIVKMWVLDSRYAPLVSIAFGIAGAFIIPVPTTTIGLTVLQGILIGLTASGLFTGVRAVSGN